MKSKDLIEKVKKQVTQEYSHRHSLVLDVCKKLDKIVADCEIEDQRKKYLAQENRIDVKEATK